MAMLVKYNYIDKLLLMYGVFEAYINLLYVNELNDNDSRERKSRLWTRPTYSESERQLHGFFNNIFEFIKTQDEEELRKATRLGTKEFFLLSNLLKQRLEKQDYIRNAIVPECRLAITLIYLAHGVCWQMLSWAFRLGYSTVRQIILEACEIIWDELSPVYLPQLNESEWEQIAADFYVATGIPHVLGAIDGKHIEIKCPPKSGTLYYNYKQYFSIVLLAACDSKYCFTAVDVGAYGSQSDGGILQASGFGSQILNETLNIPQPKLLPNSNITMPYYYIGDGAFPLKKNIMKPYPGRSFTPPTENYNKLMSGARVKIENTFGILTARWRVLTNSLNVFPDNARKIVKATIVLHNFVIKNGRNNYCPPTFIDHVSSFTNETVEGTWRQEVSPLQQSRLFTRFNASRVIFSSRDTLRDYLYETVILPQ